MFKHDADQFHQLVEEALVGFVELVERSELDHRLHIVFEQGRQDVDVGRLGVAEARPDPDEIAGHVLEQHRPFVGGRLADEAFAKLELALELRDRFRAVARDEL